MGKNKIKPKLVVHIDVDSPLKLLTFHQIKNIEYELESLVEFYEISFDRALEFFDEMNIKASFFVVGEELEKSQAIKNVILKAHNAGHEIENHTYTHPFGLATLPLNIIRNEIIKCNQIIEQITGVHPIGFRSPGYSINADILEILSENNMKYDSSAFWSIMNPILKYGHKYIFKYGLKYSDSGEVSRKLPQTPFITSARDWPNPGNKSKPLLELPLPRLKYSGIPFYNNFNLLVPKLYTRIVSNTIKKPCLVYLFHIIEFTDLTDKIPKELIVHPNLKTPVNEKINSSREIIKTLCNQYELTKTSNLLKQYI